VRNTLITSALLLCLALSLRPSVAAGDPPRRVDRGAGTGEVRVLVTGFEHARGRALVGLFRSADGFPDEGRRAARRAAAPIRDGRVVVRFRNLPSGPFAVAVMHDEDGDEEMDTGLFGIPTEGYGVSRDALRPLGPPLYEDAVLRLRAGERKRVHVRMHY